MKTVNLNSVTLLKNGEPVELMGVMDSKENPELILFETFDGTIDRITVEDVDLKFVAIILEAKDGNSAIVSGTKGIILYVNTKNLYSSNIIGTLVSYSRHIVFGADCRTGITVPFGFTSYGSNDNRADGVLYTTKTINKFMLKVSDGTPFTNGCTIKVYGIRA